MARIMTLDPERATGLQRLLAWFLRRQYGGQYLPGVMKLMLADLNVGRPAGALYNYLHLRKDSPLSRLQREMLATVVNGIIGGAA